MTEKTAELTEDLRDGILSITFNRPEKMNTWNGTVAAELSQAMQDANADAEVRAVILTGAGEKCFSAGFDVSDAANGHKTSPKGCELWRRIDRFPKPVIAAINGFALGGGLELALCCQFRIMADAPKVMLGLTELNLGIIPGWGGTQRLPLVVGKAKALDMMLFSKKIGAREALEVGLVNQISTPEKLMDDVFEFAAKLTQRPPIAVSCVLKAMAAGSYEGLDEGLRIENEGSQTVSQSNDCIEGFTAFLEKREPVFKGE